MSTAMLITDEGACLHEVNLEAYRLIAENVTTLRQSGVNLNDFLSLIRTLWLADAGTAGEGF